MTTVQIADESDLSRLFEICSLAFVRNEPFWDLLYPEHWTSPGRQAGAARFRDAAKNDPNTVFLKAIDNASGQIAGMAKWNIFKDYSFPDESAEENPENHWSSEEEQNFASEAINLFLVTRNDAIRESGGNLLSLDILAIDPEFQRRGVGGALVQWGTKLADERAVGAVVESSVPGRGLYEKNGFVLDQVVNLTSIMPEGRRTRDVGTYAWLKRPAKIGQ